MDGENTLGQLRKELEGNLKRWLPDHDRLARKELAIFDRMVTRRDFLKTTSLAALAALVHGCGDNGAGGTPSQWPGTDDIADDETTAVTTPANIVVDSDVLTSAVSYAPLAAAGSYDAPTVKAEAVLESFHPHVMTVDTTDIFVETGLKAPQRNYGIPEYVQLTQQDDTSDYALSIYEKTTAGSHGLKETAVPLDGTASYVFDRVIATNGTFHNRISGTQVYAQKLVLLAETQSSFAYGGTDVPLRLYYQCGGSALQQPGVAPSADGFDWAYIDLLDVLKQGESHAFGNFSIIEVDTYHDGSHHSFIYGTLRFDDLYNYGFVVTFNAVTDTAPTVTFFAPEFLSVTGETIDEINSMLSDYIGSEFEAKPDTSKGFGVFADQTFKPLTQMIDAEGAAIPELLFSFVNYDFKSYDPESSSEFTWPSKAYEENNYMVKRNVFALDVSTGGIVYTMQGIKPVCYASSWELNFYFEQTLLDIWESIYEKNYTMLEQVYIRSALQVDGGINILLAGIKDFTPKNSFDDLAVVQKSVTLTYEGSISYATDDVKEALTAMNEPSVDQDGQTMHYSELWFSALFSNVMGYDADNATMWDLIRESASRFQSPIKFYFTQNHQGILKCYFVLEMFHGDDRSQNRFVINFSETGLTDKELPYQTPDNLRSQIEAQTQAFHVPLPIVSGPVTLFPWHAVSGNEEVLCSANRRDLIDETTQTLISNDGSQGRLYSYVHATSDLVTGNWVVEEEQRQLSASDAVSAQASIELHQVHLHVTNVYGLTATLDDDTYVEVRFTQQMIVKDQTDPANPVTYRSGPFTSIFLKPDASAKIALEIDMGSKDAKYGGAVMQYRFVDKTAFTLQEDTPVTALTGTEGVTSAFKQCNISFRMYERCGTDAYDSVQTGAPAASGTVKSALQSNVGSSYQSDIPTFAQGYASLHASVAPDNASATVALAQVYGVSYAADGSVRLVANFAGVASRCLFCAARDWIKHAAHTISHAVSTVVQTVVSGLDHVVSDADKALAKAAHAFKSAAEVVAESIEAVVANIASDVEHAAKDLAIAVQRAWDDTKSFAEKLWNWIKALFDMDTAWEIGQNLQTAFTAQFSAPEDSGLNNLYTLVRDGLTDAGDAVNALGSTVDDDIDAVFGTATDNGRTQGRQHYGNAKTHTSKSHHILDQLQRLMSNFTLPGTDGCTLDASSPLMQSLDGGFDAIVEVGEGLENIGTGLVEDIETVVRGTSFESVQATLGQGITQINDGLISGVDSILPLPILIIDDFVNGECSLESLDEVEMEVLELLGVLLFQNKDKFQNVRELAAFTMGFFLNIFSLVIGGLSDVKVGSYLTSDTFTEDFTQEVSDHLGGTGVISGDTRVVFSILNAIGLTFQSAITVLDLQTIRLWKAAWKGVRALMMLSSIPMRATIGTLSIPTVVGQSTAASLPKITNEAVTTMQYYSYGFTAISSLFDYFSDFAPAGAYPDYDPDNAIRDVKAFAALASLTSSVLSLAIAIENEKDSNYSTEMKALSLGLYSVAVFQTLLAGYIAKLIYEKKKEGESVGYFSTLSLASIGNTVLGFGFSGINYEIAQIES